jgi:hypothetical protein
VHCCLQTLENLAQAADKTWKEACNRGAFDMYSDDSSDDDEYCDSDDDALDASLLKCARVDTDYKMSKIQLHKRTLMQGCRRQSILQAWRAQVWLVCVCSDGVVRPLQGADGL